MDSRLFWFIVGVVALLWWHMHGPVTPTPGMCAPNDPIQTEYHGKPWMSQGCLIVPLAQYDITARVLLRQEYHFDAFAKLCPLDLCLSWGPLSDPKIYNQIHFTQDSRWYEYQYDHELPPGIATRINHCVANNHVIPANAQIKDQLMALRQNQSVELKGYLIEATFPDKSIYRSSLSRDDKGGGACEIIWVESVNTF